MRKIPLIIICLLYSSLILGQGDPSQYWDHFDLNNDSLGHILVNVTNESIQQKKPLLLFIEGSGSMPLFFKLKDGRYGTGITLDYKKYSADYHIAVVSKPGIPFMDSLHYTESGRRYYPRNSEYTNYYSLYWRAKAASLAIDYLIQHIPIDTSLVVVMGHSEGAQVAPAVAVENSKVTHVISMMSNSLSQLYDFLIEERLKVIRGQLTAEKAQQNIDSLYSEFENIHKNPNSTGQTWYGETFLKWSSTSVKSPLDNMLELNIPILYIAGGMDRNQNIFNMDYARLEFIRKGKDNLTYKVYPNCDHYFQERIQVDGVEKSVDRIDEVHDFAMDWVQSIKH